MDLKFCCLPILFRILFPQDPLLDLNHSAAVDAIQVANKGTGTDTAVEQGREGLASSQVKSASTLLPQMRKSDNHIEKWPHSCHALAAY